jgi:hypothetical protein
MNLLKRIAHILENIAGITVEAKSGHGTLEVDCIVRNADGTIKSRETAVRPVNFKCDHLGQVVKIDDVVVGRKP